MSNLSGIDDSTAHFATAWINALLTTQVTTADPDQGLQTPEGTLTPADQSTIATAGGPPGLEIEVQDQEASRPTLTNPDLTQWLQRLGSGGSAATTSTAGTAEATETQETNASAATQTLNGTSSGIAGLANLGPGAVAQAFMQNVQNEGAQELGEVFASLSPEAQLDIQTLIESLSPTTQPGFGSFAQQTNGEGGQVSPEAFGGNIIQFALANSNIVFTGEELDAAPPGGEFGSEYGVAAHFEHAPVDFNTANESINPNSAEAQAVMDQFKAENPNWQNMDPLEVSAAINAIVDQQIQSGAIEEGSMTGIDIANLKASAMLGMLKEQGVPNASDYIEVIVGVDSYTGQAVPLVCFCAPNGERDFFTQPGGHLPLGFHDSVPGLLAYVSYTADGVNFHRPPEECARLSESQPVWGNDVQVSDVNHLAIVAMVTAMIAILKRLISSEDMEKINKEAEAIQGNFEARLEQAAEKAAKIQELLEELKKNKIIAAVLGALMGALMLPLLLMGFLLLTPAIIVAVAVPSLIVPAEKELAEARAAKYTPIKGGEEYNAAVMVEELMAMIQMILGLLAALVAMLGGGESGEGGAGAGGEGGASGGATGGAATGAMGEVTGDLTAVVEQMSGSMLAQEGGYGGRVQGSRIPNAVNSAINVAQNFKTMSPNQQMQAIAEVMQSIMTLMAEFMAMAAIVDKKKGEEFEEDYEELKSLNEQLQEAATPEQPGLGTWGMKPQDIDVAISDLLQTMSSWQNERPNDFVAPQG